MKHLNCVLCLMILFSSVIVSCEKDVTNPEPIANFSASKTSVAVGETITFTNSSENATSYSWNFGDSNTSTDENPTHTFSRDGTFEVTLTAIRDGVKNSTSITITVITTNTSLIGEWILTNGSFNNTEISNLGGGKKFETALDNDSDLEYRVSSMLTTEIDDSYVIGNYRVSGDTIEMINIIHSLGLPWSNSSDFDKFGVVCLGTQNVTYSISGVILTITGANSYGTTVLTYMRDE